MESHKAHTVLFIFYVNDFLPHLQVSEWVVQPTHKQDYVQTVHVWKYMQNRFHNNYHASSQ